MTLDEALDLVSVKHPRYRELCDESWPEHEEYRRLVFKLADAPVEDPPPEPPAYPSAATMARSAVKAVVGFAASGFKTRTQEEQDACLAICYVCEQYDAATGRCRKCGCWAVVKARVASQNCPLKKW